MDRLHKLKLSDLIWIQSDLIGDREITGAIPIQAAQDSGPN